VCAEKGNRVERFLATDDSGKNLTWVKERGRDERHSSPSRRNSPGIQEETVSANPTKLLQSHPHPW